MPNVDNVPLEPSDHSRSASDPDGWPRSRDPVKPGWVSLDQVQRAPYHRFLRKACPPAQVAALYPSEEMLRKHSAQRFNQSESSHVHVYDSPCTGGPTRHTIHWCCQIKLTEFLVEDLEGLRRQILNSAQVKDRVLVVENLSPPVMEVLGRSCTLPASLFTRHIGNSWVITGRTLPAALDSRALMIGNDLLIAVPQPSLVTLEYVDTGGVRPAERLADPTSQNALLNASRSCLKYLQGDTLWPLSYSSQHKELHTVVCTHATVLIRPYMHNHVRVVILTAPSIEKSQSIHGAVHLKLSVSQPVSMATGVDQTEHTAQRHTEGRALADILRTRLASDGHDTNQEGSPIATLRIVIDEALASWSAHVTHVAAAVGQHTSPIDATQQSTIEDVRVPEQIKAVILKSVLAIAEFSDSVTTVKSWCNGTSPSFRTDTEDHSQSWLSNVSDRLDAVRLSLERHLPVLQHQIDTRVLQQQLKLATTQLEESRKSIEQTDNVRRLTILAFVYIPVQSAAGVFGMNVRELSDGPPVWMFAVLAIGLLFVTVSVAVVGENVKAIRQFSLRSYRRWKYRHQGRDPATFEAWLKDD